GGRAVGPGSQTVSVKGQAVGAQRQTVGPGGRAVGPPCRGGDEVRLVERARDPRGRSTRSDGGAATGAGPQPILNEIARASRTPAGPKATAVPGALAAPFAAPLARPMPLRFPIRSRRAGARSSLLGGAAG